MLSEFIIGNHRPIFRGFGNWLWFGLARVEWVAVAFMILAFYSVVSGCTLEYILLQQATTC